MSVHLYVDKIFVNEIFFRGIEFENPNSPRGQAGIQKTIDINRFS
jgi:hypothetical protein